VSAAQFAELTNMIAFHDLRTEWDGMPFASGQITRGEPLSLYAHEVAWGVFENLEQYCCDNNIAYVRQSDGCAGSFGPERIVYNGKNGPLNYATDDDDEVVLHISTLEQLATMQAIRAYLKPANYVVPPLVISD
jgi:hypothetical protein